MNSIKNTSVLSTASIQRNARFAGFMFLFCFIVPTLNWSFVLSGFMVDGDALATTRNILDNQILFRIGLIIELFMSIGLILLGVVLYKILKAVNTNLALAAIFLKLLEATLTAIIVLVSFIALLIVDGKASLEVFSSEQLMAPLGFILSHHTVLYSIPMLVLGLDMMVFTYLFLKSKLIPRIISAFGIFSFALIFIHAFMSILTPEFAKMEVIQMIFWAPSGLFEIIIGVWLLSKGLNFKKGDILVFESK